MRAAARLVEWAREGGKRAQCDIFGHNLISYDNAGKRKSHRLLPLPTRSVLEHNARAARPSGAAAAARRAL